MAQKHLVIVESAAKAKTINKYLGKDFVVVASYGHVRDLPSKNGSVLPDKDFEMIWEVDGRASKSLADITKAVKETDTLYLATDPDREGEAISWHLAQVLEEKKVLKGRLVQRIVFYEITPSAIKQALANPRPIHQPLVDAYLARRALDYLVGFTLSPILWRKLPGARSAGRVQSVALRLIVDRENEIEQFRPQEYWTLSGHFNSAKNQQFVARLTHLGGKKLDKFGLPTQDQAEKAQAQVNQQTYTIAKVEKKTVNRHPAPPFSTSTLQQEASRKLGYGASRTMQLAQRLYEGVDIGGETAGLITYMRTDSVQMAKEAIESARDFINQTYGANYVPDAPRLYKSKAKNAQEAHEAVRPTSLSRTPDQVRPYLDDAQYRLYELVWRRAVASQMASALFDQVGVDIVSQDRQITLRATGSTLVFDGFLRLYQESRDDEEDEDGENRLPPLAEGESADLKRAEIDQHFTQPPPRYSEASLVKRLEELGIGRPSTYVTIISVLQDRSYVRLERKQFIPEERGRLVTVFLLNYFRKYVEYDFTANLESELDEISAGERAWRDVMTRFWEPFIGTVKQTESLRTAEVLDKLQEDMAAYLFPQKDGVPASRTCPVCEEGEVHLKVSKYGPFLGCSRYPECKYTRPIAQGDGDAEKISSEPQNLGQDPATGKGITLRKGPYGYYLQWDDPTLKKGEKPKRVSIPTSLDPGSVDLEKALLLGALPKQLGQDPETGEAIVLGIGRFGPYVKRGALFASIPKTASIFDVELDLALQLLSEKKDKPSKEGRFSKGKAAKTTKTSKTGRKTPRKAKKGG